MIKRLFKWETTADKVKSLAAWFILSFIFPGMYTVFRWFSWLFAEHPNHYYLDRGWLFFITTLNLGMLIWTGILLAIAWMLRDYYKNRREVIREVDEVIQPVEGPSFFPIKFMKEKEPEDDADYQAELEEAEMTERQLLAYLKENPPTSRPDCDMMLKQVQEIPAAKMWLLNHRKKLPEMDANKIKVGNVVDFTDA